MMTMKAKYAELIGKLLRNHPGNVEFSPSLPIRSNISKQQ
jgi:hypothetical protein